MKKTALIYALWSKNLAILDHYLQTRVRAVIMPGHLIDDAVRQLVANRSCELHVLPTDGSVQQLHVTQRLIAHLTSGVASIGLADDPSSRQVLECIATEAATNLPIVEGWLDVLSSLARDYDIEITVLNEDVMREGKTLAAWSRAHGIPVLQIAHGTGMGRDYVGETSLSDHMAVAGRRSAEYFEDLGFPADHIHVIGNLQWEILPALVQQRPQLRAELAKAYALSPDDRWIVWGTTWNAHLSALDNRDAVEQMEDACRTLVALHAAGLTNVKLVFKDRPAIASLDAAREQFARIAAAHDITDHVRFATDDGRYWAAGADVTVSYESNLAIESMLADVPAINVVTDFGAVAGGAFGAHDGVLEAPAGELQALIARLFTDPAFRAASLCRDKTRYHDAGAVGVAARAAQLIGRCAREIRPAAPAYVWQQYLDVESAGSVEAYHAYGRSDLVSLFSNNPRMAIDVGCAAGSTAALLKQRFPQCRVWGVEMNRAAAATASQKIDRVLLGKFEDFDLEREGIAKGTLDAVLLADVLEHMYNPWDVMVKLRPYMSPQGQLVLSIPNVRNLTLLDDLSKGNWTYAAAGLLDITHIRFFTLTEIRKFCHETGYRITQTLNSIDRRLESLWTANQGQTLTTIDTERITLKNLTRDELMEVCTIQFYVVLEKDSTRE
jgi:2-polyprenyl-3-methyl-5-hydroxy-6-metoxy-1,4-benzoquinol methylase